MNIDQMNTLRNKINRAANSVDTSLANGGTCGYGDVLVFFGRKKKLKELFIDEGMVPDYCTDFYGKRAYYLCYKNPVGTQSYEYNTKVAFAIYEAIKDDITKLGLEITTHTWVD